MAARKLTMAASSSASGPPIPRLYNLRAYAHARVLWWHLTHLPGGFVPPILPKIALAARRLTIPSADIHNWTHESWVTTVRARLDSFEKLYPDAEQILLWTAKFELTPTFYKHETSVPIWKLERYLELPLTDDLAQLRTNYINQAEAGLVELRQAIWREDLPEVEESFTNQFQDNPLSEYLELAGELGATAIYQYLEKTTTHIPDSIYRGLARGGHLDLLLQAEGKGDPIAILYGAVEGGHRRILEHYMHHLLTSTSKFKLAIASQLISLCISSGQFHLYPYLVKTLSPLFPAADRARTVLDACMRGLARCPSVEEVAKFLCKKTPILEQWEVLVSGLYHSPHLDVNRLPT